MSGPVRISKPGRPFISEKVPSVTVQQQKQADTTDAVADTTITPFRIKAKDVEMQTPMGSEYILTGTLAAISSTLGPVTVDGNLTMSSTATTRTIYFRASSTNYLQLGTNVVSIVVGDTASDHLYLKRGSTTVMSFQGDANTVTFTGDLDVNGTGTTDFAGAVTAHGKFTAASATASEFTGDLDINGTGTTTCDGDVQLASGKTFKGKHASAAAAARADGTFTFYAAATSGGAVTQKHDVTFADGLITGWVVT